MKIPLKEPKRFKIGEATTTQEKLITKLTTKLCVLTHDFIEDELEQKNINFSLGVNILMSAAASNYITTIQNICEMIGDRDEIRRFMPNVDKMLSMMGDAIQKNVREKFYD